MGISDPKNSTLALIILHINIKLNKFLVEQRGCTHRQAEFLLNSAIFEILGHCSVSLVELAEPGSETAKWSGIVRVLVVACILVKEMEEICLIFFLQRK